MNWIQIYSYDGQIGSVVKNVSQRSEKCVKYYNLFELYAGYQIKSLDTFTERMNERWNANTDNTNKTQWLIY